MYTEKLSRSPSEIFRGLIEMPLTIMPLTIVDFCTSKMYNLHVQRQIRNDR